MLHDNMYLFSGQPFRDNIAGYAPVNGMCMIGQSIGIATISATTSINDAAATTAHELGHNFGMSHTADSATSVGVDASTQATCFDSSGTNKHIMDAMSYPNDPPSAWSACSNAWLMSYYAGTPAGCNCNANQCTKCPYYGQWTNYPTCLEQTPATVWTESGSTCGDGFLEEAEECDCGARPCSEVDPCCNGATCMLKTSATCSAKDTCCDSSTCNPRLVSEAHVCRASAGACGVAEMCDGSSATCPPDAHQVVGVPCTGERSSYAGICSGNGMCNSHTELCWRSMHFYAKTSGWSECSYAGDADGDTACQKLKCTSSDYGTCHSNNHHVQDDPELEFYVDDGTPCAANRACLNKVCAPYTHSPTMAPTQVPTSTPTTAPTPPTSAPTSAPTPPTQAPTHAPSTAPTPPTVAPSMAPSVAPTKAKTLSEHSTELWDKFLNAGPEVLIGIIIAILCLFCCCCACTLFCVAICIKQCKGDSGSSGSEQATASAPRQATTTSSRSPARERALKRKILSEVVLETLTVQASVPASVKKGGLFKLGTPHGAINIRAPVNGPVNIQVRSLLKSAAFVKSIHVLCLSPYHLIVYVCSRFLSASLLGEGSDGRVNPASERT